MSDSLLTMSILRGNVPTMDGPEGELERCGISER